MAKRQVLTEQGKSMMPEGERDQKTRHPGSGDLDRMTKKPQSLQRELAEARRVLNNVVIPPAMEDQTAVDEMTAESWGRSSWVHGEACDPRRYSDAPRIQAAWCRGWIAEEQAQRQRRGEGGGCFVGR